MAQYKGVNLHGLVGGPTSPHFPSDHQETAVTDSIIETLASEDVLHRFMLEKAGVRGVLVRLGASWHEIASRIAYPTGLRDTLGQAVAASALLTGNIKFEGSLSIEFKSQGPLRLLFTECTDKGHLRGLARYDADTLSSQVDLASQPEAFLAITIGHAERGRYQGIVDLDDTDSIGEALENYFERSEQLPARILLAANGDHAVGLMLQPVPGEGGPSAAGDGHEAGAPGGRATAPLKTTMRRGPAWVISRPRSAPARCSPRARRNCCIASITRNPCACTNQSRWPSVAPARRNAWKACCARWAARKWKRRSRIAVARSK